MRRHVGLLRALLAGAPLVLGAGTGQAQVALADQPLFTNTSVPGNLALALSVEWPTASRAAYPTDDGGYDNARTYLGYFDPNKCYVYQGSLPEADRYFTPSGASTATHTCTGKWSGNFLNWATTQAIDPFRWALTGGYRVVDTATETILQKAYHAGQGLFPNRGVSNSTVVSGATPFNISNFYIRIGGAGIRMLFSPNSVFGTDQGATLPATITPYASGTSLTSNAVYSVNVRVKVCDASAGAGGVEANCKQYGSNWKPEGLIQQYSDRMRFSAFGYLNDPDGARDGGVLRAQQKFVGPTQPVPGSSPVANSAREWDPATGVMALNPDASDATSTTGATGVTVSHSGVMNYLNKFGQVNPGDYKSYDPVSELFYTVLRYFKNQGNVPAYTSMGSASLATKTRWVDGFPVITNWNDPIIYSCQRNFILGIGDIYTHRDKNLPGTGTGTTNEPTKPAEVSGDTTVSAVTATNKVFALQGLAAPNWNDYSGRNNSAGIAGLAYYANTNDIRPDVTGQSNTIGRQTVQTYWVDVLEQPFVANNQFYLAAKYGGFRVPTNYDWLNQSSALTQDWWSQTGAVVPGSTQVRPDNYFTAGRPDTMISGLQAAFADIAAQMQAYTTSFSTSMPQVSVSGNASYSTQYDTRNWTGELTANELSFNAAGVPSQQERWRFSQRLASQLAGTGWDTARRVVTWNTSTNSAVPFRHANLSTAQRALLDPAYRGGDDSADYVNYLRGQRLHEASSTDPTSSRAYRTRTSLLGDIVNSKARPVGPPSNPFSNAANPGYAAFKSAYASRPTVVYVGGNDGMLHAVNGALTGASSGSEIFAYVPSMLLNGPTAPATNGLVALGNPSFTHRNYVDGMTGDFDIDLSNTAGVAAGTAPNWRTVLIGGLGKGGKGYYAIDITDPTSITTESGAAARLMWEFTDPDMGFSYGEPVVVKTRRWGWVVVFTSGYNNTDGRGYFFIVNPRTGALLQKVSTGVGSATNQSGLAYANGYVLDRTDGMADAIYGGDLLGNLWRLDITSPGSNYPAPTLIARLTDASGNAQPVTSRPLIEVQPNTNRRFVMVGTGRLLDASDIAISRMQTYYAILDGTAGRFNAAGQLPAGVTFPITRSNLLNNSTVGGVTFNAASQMGWFIDLTVSAQNIAWRVTNPSSTLNGYVTFASSLPNGNVCNPSGTSNLYFLNFGTGRTALPDNVAFTQIAGSVTDLRFLSVSDGTGATGRGRAIYGTADGNQGTAGEVPPGSTGTRRLNWRELPTVN